MSEYKVIECKYEEIEFISKMKTGDAKFAKRSKPEVWFKCLYNNTIIACSCLLILSKERVRMSSAFVFPEHRRKGILKKMVDERIHWSKERNYKIIDVRPFVTDFTQPKYSFELKQKYKRGGWYEKKL